MYDSNMIFYDITYADIIKCLITGCSFAAPLLRQFLNFTHGYRIVMISTFIIIEHISIGFIQNMVVFIIKLNKM